MRDRGLLVSGLVLVVLVTSACRKERDETAEKGAPNGKATVPGAVLPTQAPPTMTPTEIATPTVAPTPSPLPTAPPQERNASADELELIGIVRGAQSPSALIGYKGREEIFRKGDSVFDHGTVKDVRDDSVVIRSAGEDVTLKLAKETTAGPLPAKPAEEIVEAAPPVQPAAPAPASEPLSRAEARAALKDFSSSLQQADAKRVAIGGGHGLQLGKVDAGSFFAKLGLRNGDVLQKVNGMVVDDPEHLPDLSSAAEGKELTISFSRDDVGLTVARRVQ